MVAKYKCSVCGYVYDPERGDPQSDIAPCMPLAELICISGMPSIRGK